MKRTILVVISIVMVMCVLFSLTGCNPPDLDIRDGENKSISNNTKYNYITIYENSSFTIDNGNVECYNLHLYENTALNINNNSTLIIDTGCFYESTSTINLDGNLILKSQDEYTTPEFRGLPEINFISGSIDCVSGDMYGIYDLEDTLSKNGIEYTKEKLYGETYHVFASK